MLWLALHMWALLLAAFSIGLAVGWWIWGQRQSATAPAISGETQARGVELGSLDLDGDASEQPNAS
ncbi:hypothetical protein [Hyphococcus sp.]|uniref:hypothetical protein n=1 Tax=Hyphococcus sp. TaxID=2038636 RepID=UPI0035C6A779